MASLVGDQLLLTGTGAYEAGSAFYSSPVSSRDLDVTFVAAMGGGTGADGMALALINPSDVDSGRQAVGGTGGALGFAPLDGLAVALVTTPNGSITASNFIGIAQSAPPGSSTALTFLAINDRVPALRDHPRHVRAVARGGVLSVSVDGVQYLRLAVTLPRTILIGFTAAAGRLTDRHAVTHVHVVAGPPIGG